MRPNRSSVACAAALASAALVTSSFTTRRFSDSPTALATFSVLRPVATTLWPAANAALAISRPRPRPAPVINQTLIVDSCSLAVARLELRRDGQQGLMPHAEGHSSADHITAGG